MPDFEELRLLYTAWNGKLFQYHIDANQLVVRLAAHFREHIAAPKTFVKPDGSEGLYVEPMKVRRGHDGYFQFEEAGGSILDIASREDDGWWIAGIKIILDQGENAYPKRPFCFFLTFFLRDREGELYFEDTKKDRFKFVIDDIASLDPLCEGMVSILQKTLATPPWGVWEKGPIGFAHPVPKGQSDVMGEA